MKNFFPAQNGTYSYLQTNRSDKVGSLWATTNVNFQNNIGVLQLGTKLRPNTTSAQEANLGLPYAFKAFDGRVFSICGSRVFKNTGNDVISQFSEDVSSGATTAYSVNRSDMEVYNNALVTANASNIYTKVSNGSGTGAWTNRGSVSADYHKMRYFKKFDKLYYLTLKTQVHSMNTDFSLNTSGDYTIQLDETIGQATTIDATSDSLWIGTIKVYNSASGINTIEKASVLQWDGISAQITREYLIDAQAVLAITIKDDIPWIMDSNGILRKFTGSSFEEVGRLPLINELLYNATYGDEQRFIHPNGLITTKNDTIMAFINNRIGDSSGSTKENLPSGIWEWSKENGFTHRSSITYQPVGSDTITDYGQNRISAAGALANANIYSDSVDGRGTLLVGSTYYTNASSTANGIFIDSPIPVNTPTTPEGPKKGSFITTWFQSQEVQDKWLRLWAIYKRFKNETDRIVFKYRLTEDEPTIATITWTSTTTFTTTTNITAYWTSGTGGEVEILNGTGGGNCAHITNITENAGTYTVTLDTVITGVTNGTAVARFQHWIKLFPEASGLVKSWTQMNIDAFNTEIQLKGFMTFTGSGEFIKVALFSNEDIKINP